MANSNIDTPNTQIKPLLGAKPKKLKTLANGLANPQNLKKQNSPKNGLVGPSAGKNFQKGI